MTPAARVGDRVDAIETPALVVDVDAMERNLSTMAGFARQHGLRMRPHAKTHKSAEIARRQIAAGAVGVCVQKVGEAEALADCGIEDIFISNEIIDPVRLRQVAALAKRIRLAIAVDSALGIDRLAEALHAAGSEVGVFVEVDVGQGRCGVAPAAAGALAHAVVARGLTLAGLHAYHGGAQHLRSAAEREAAARDAAARTRVAQASLTAGGMACPLVSGGGTGSFAFDAEAHVCGELQVGSYVFMDRDYGDNQPGGAAPAFEQALFVRSRVISRGLAHAVLDAGHKAHSIDSGPPAVWQRDLLWTSTSDEHGVVRAGRDALPALGEALWLVPGHCDPTVNLHDHYVAVRDGLQQGTVEAIWKVDARGCIR